MNIKQMQREFGIQMNQLSEALALESDDIEYWLNKAQINLVKQLYNGSRGKGFEQSQERIDDLKILLVKDLSESCEHELNQPVLDGFHIDKARFPVDLMFGISYRSKVQYKHPVVSWFMDNGKRKADGSFSTKVVFNRFSQADDIYKLLTDPFNTTKPSNPLTDINEDFINVYTNNTFVVDEVIFNYLRIPQQMSIERNISSELPEHLHKDLIQKAVDLFLNNTRELKQRLQRETPTADTTQIEEQ
jgi:hypothetical protein